MTGLFVSDCIEFMLGMEAETVDLTVTSPPYDNLRNYNGYRFDFERVAKQLYRITKPEGVVVRVVGDKINGGRGSVNCQCERLFARALCGEYMMCE